MAKVLFDVGVFIHPEGSVFFLGKKMKCAGKGGYNELNCCPKTGLPSRVSRPIHVARRIKLKPFINFTK